MYMPKEAYNLHPSNDMPKYHITYMHFHILQCMWLWWTCLNYSDTLFSIFTFYYFS
jgi:hypothetical protein